MITTVVRGLRDCRAEKRQGASGPVTEREECSRGIVPVGAAERSARQRHRDIERFAALPICNQVLALLQPEAGVVGLEGDRPVDACQRFDQPATRSDRALSRPPVRMEFCKSVESSYNSAEAANGWWLTH